MAKKKVLILGGGLAALSAGIHLLQEQGSDRFEVKLLCMEHRLGGKAASYRLADGRFMDIGFHAVFGYYTALQTLLKRAGRSIDDPQWFTSNEGVHRMYEADARAVNELDIPAGPLDVGALFNSGFVGYDGMSLSEKFAAAKWMATIGAELLTGEVSPDIDEYSFTSYCVSTGLDIELTKKSWFRYVLDLAFNYPAAGSAYVGLAGFRKLMSPDNSLVHYFNGPLSEVAIAPLADLFLSLGGTVEFCQKVTSLELDPTSHELKALGVTSMANTAPIAGASDHVSVSPIGGTYSLSDAPYPVGDPATPSGAPVTNYTLGTDFDYVVSTLPVDSFRALLRTASNFEAAVLDEPELRKIWGLRSVASLSMRVWFPSAVMPADFDTVVMGTPQPAATLIDYKHRVRELRQGTWGSVVEFEGQEGLHGELTDPQLVRSLIEDFRQLPFVLANQVDVDDVMNQTNGHLWELRRNTAHHMRYLLMEPGHWKYRPTQTNRPYQNLVLAGDWMQSTQPTASMEAAVRTGRVAADLLRHDEGVAAVVA